jgi:hypothetical protein
MHWKQIAYLLPKSEDIFLVVKELWSMFRGIIIWTIWIEQIDLVFNNARWDYFNVQGTIWEALINYGKAKWDKCSINFSLTKGMNYLDRFDKCYMCQV